MPAPPKISVVMPSYGKAAFVSEAIESVLGQTFADIELIVVDDRSIDGSLPIALKFSAADKRARVIAKPVRTGVSSAMNTGIRSALGEAIAFIGADDIYAPVKLEKQWESLIRESDTTVIDCDRWKLDAEGNAIPKARSSTFPRNGWIFGDLLARGFGQIASLLVPRVCFDKVGLFDESLKWSEDYDLELRLARAYRFSYIPEKLYGYRVYQGNTSQSIGRTYRLSIQCGVVEKYLRESGDLLSHDQRARAEAELLRFYWETGQRGKLLNHAVRSASGIRFVVRHAAKALLGDSGSKSEKETKAETDIHDSVVK
jgi:glycosyltransferase involved in cell wall biosynthesis